MRNAGIGVGVVIVLVVAVIAVAVIAGIYLLRGSLDTNPEPPMNFYMGISPNSGKVTQGSSTMIEIDTTYVSGKHDGVTLSGDSGSSGIQFSFDSTINQPSSKTRLTINVPASTPTDVYSLKITANCGSLNRRR